MTLPNVQIKKLKLFWNSYYVFILNMISTMQSTLSNDDMPLFQNCHQFDGLTNTLKKDIQMMNNMIEIGYIENTMYGLRFTNSGLQYMLKKHDDFINNVNNVDQSKLDFNVFAGVIQLMLDSSSRSNGPGNDIGTGIIKNYFNIDNCDEVDYNNITFNKKADGDLEG